ncbi:Mur ligase family protein [Guggenheimella bovis]
MKLKELIPSFEGDIEIRSIQWDSREVKEGDLFVALVGKLQDGHRYIEQAVKSGAVAVVGEREVECAVPLFIVENSREMLARLSARFFNDASKDLTLAVVTATNGKTTTVGMLRKILEADKKNVGIMGTVAVEYGDVSIPSLLTTPESADIQRHLRDMKEAGVTHVTMEASSIGLSTHRLDHLHVKVAAFNNLSNEHMDLHGDFESYFRAKALLIERLEKGSFAVLNYDDERIRNIQTSAERVYFSVSNKQVDVSIDEVDLTTGRAKFVLLVNRSFEACKIGRYPLELKIPGYHSLVNALSAITMSLLLGVGLDAIQKGLHDFEGVERRFEIIYEKDFKVIDDHFANKGNIDVTLKTLSMMDYKNIVFVYAIRGNRGVDTNKENAEAIVEWNKTLHFKKIIATRSTDHTMKKDEVHPEEQKVFEETLKANDLSYDLYDTLEEAVLKGLDLTGPGDLLLLAGCQGMDFGGSILLHEVVRRNPSFDKNEILKPLQSRVCGHLELTKS